MDRVQKRLRHVDLNGLGIEVAPCFSPMVPKRNGHNILVLDVFDTAALRERARSDPLIPAERVSGIEDVDIVTDASQIGAATRALGLTGKVDYIMSSHNFEHLPNPILFLAGVAQTLAPGGVLSMALLDDSVAQIW